MPELKVKEREQKLSIWIPLLLSIMMVAGMTIGRKMEQTTTVTTQKKDFESLGLDKVKPGRLEEILSYIDAMYVEDVQRNKLEQSIIEKMFKELDPHSSYISLDEINGRRENLQGKFYGIGIEYLILDDTLRVIDVLEDGPAASAGLEKGDDIIIAKDTVISGVGYDVSAIPDLFRGDKGTDLKLTYHRAGSLNDLIVSRGEIPINSIDASLMLDQNTGFIKLNRFSATTYKEFMLALEDLVENHSAKHLVIDLRQNPGGYLQEAIKILSQIFDDKNKLLVYTEGRAVRKNEYKTSGNNFFDLDQVIILIDEGSASASEIIAGAVQDWDRGLLIGRRTYGKGLVQEEYNLKDGSAILLTIARYFTPSGRLIQRDYLEKEEYYGEMQDRLESGELMTGERENQSDSTKFYTASGREVFGGGGVSADIFVPLDTLFLNDDFSHYSSFFSEFAYKELYQNGFNFEGDADKFVKQHSIPNAQFDRFLNQYSNEEFTKQKALNPILKKGIKKYIKAALARQLFDENAQQMVINDSDPFIKEALKGIQSKKILASGK